MQLTPQNIQEHGFEFLEKVDHSEYKLFLQKLNWRDSKMHFIYNFCLGTFLVFAIILIVKSHELYFFKITYALLGVLLAIILVIVHELIHYLMYMLYGAKNIKIKRYSRKTYILTQADHFLVGNKEIKWIAVMPYLIITLSCLILIPFLNDLMQILLSSTILFHTTMSKEDFRIIHYFSSQRAEVKMYTDIKSGITYFYKRSVRD